MSAVLRPLDVERAVPVLLSALDTAGLDTPELLQLLQRGTCSVLVEAAVPIERLYRFDEGGINPQGQPAARTGYTVSEVRRNSDALALVLENQKVLRTFYVHEPLKRPDEVPTSDWPSLVVEGQLLYMRDATLLSADDLASFVSKNSLSWHFLMFCTDSPARSYERMGDLISDSICLVCGVYDGESYLVWAGRRE